MKRSKIMIAFATLFVAQIAAAQMMGGGSHHGTSPAPGTGSGGMNGGMSSDMGGAMAGGMSHAITVGTDGVVYTLRATSSNSTTPTVEVVAIRPSGTIAWTAKVDAGMTRLDVSGNLVLVTSGYGDMGMDGSNAADDDASTLTALSATSGSVQWQLEVDGAIGAMEPFSGGVYAVVVQHGTTNSGTGMHNGANGTSMKRSIQAIDANGKVT